MRGKKIGGWYSFASLMAAILWCSVTTARSTQQSAAPAPAAASIEQQLQANYEPFVKTSSDSTGLVVTKEGKLLTIQSGAVMGVPPQNTTAGCASTFENGELQPPGNKCTKARNYGSQAASKVFGRFGGKLGGASSNVNTDRSGAQFFKNGDKVYAKNVTVDQEKGIVSFYVMACDTCNKTDPPTHYIAQVNFKFDQKTFETGDISKMEDTIAQVFNLDNSGGSQDQGQAQGGQDQGQAQAAAPAAAAPAAPAQPQAQPQTVQLGQTTDQVEAILGKPTTIVDLGAKKKWVYKDLKITFMNGKVSDVE